MGWNDAHIVFAPRDARTETRSDPLASTAEGGALRVFSTELPEEAVLQAPFYETFKRWLLRLGFTLERANPPFFAYSLEDVSLTVRSDEGRVTHVSARFQIELNARERLLEWEKLARALCKEFGMRIADGEKGLVEANHFRGLIESSFGWQCFLERKRNEEQGER